MDEMDYEIDLMEMLGVLARRGWQIAAFMVISMVVAYFVSSNMTKIYKATSVIMVRNDSAVMSIPFLKDAAGSSSGDMRNYVESLKSRTLAEATLSRLGWLESSGGQEVRAWQNSLSVQQVQGADIARLSVECSNPEKAALFLNTLVEVFQERTQQMNQESARAARDFIQQQLAVAEERLRESESELLRYKETKGIIEPSSETRAWVEKLANIEEGTIATVHERIFVAKGEPLLDGNVRGFLDKCREFAEDNREGGKAFVHWIREMTSSRKTQEPVLNSLLTY
jgi:uncharacterized protein involved in exopolysaccharide biosynthesis